ncbi:MAG: helix-turn-helix transcriptional regulator [Beijerinckiaceae bacterium]
MFNTDALLELNAVVSAFYDASLGRCGWNQTLERAAIALDASAFALAICNEATGSARLFAGGIGLDEHQAWLIAEATALAPAAASSEPLSKLEDSFVITPAASMRESRFFRACCQPQGFADAIGATLDCQSGAIYSLVFLRGADQPAFCDSDAERLEHVIAHAVRAVRISGELDQLRAERDSLAKAVHEAPTPIILVNEDRSIRQINRAAAQLSDRGGFIRNEQGELCFEDQDCARVFSSAVGAGEVHATTIVCKSGSGLVSEVMPGMRGGGAAAIVLVHKAPARAERSGPMLRQAYGLTGSELRVLTRLMAGATRDAISGDLGISLATVKTHLQNIFRKTGTNRQADLVRKIGVGIAA